MSQQFSARPRRAVSHYILIGHPLSSECDSFYIIPPKVRFVKGFPRLLQIFSALSEDEIHRLSLRPRSPHILPKAVEKQTAAPDKNRQTQKSRGKNPRLSKNYA